MYLVIVYQVLKNMLRNIREIPIKYYQSNQFIHSLYLLSINLEL